MSGSKSDKVRLVKPPEKLKQKVGPLKRPTETAFAKAEEMARAMEPEAAMVEAELRTMAEAVARARDDLKMVPVEFQDIYKVAHDMRGYGKTIGYDLVTDVAHNLCVFIEAEPPETLDSVKTVQAHVEALSGILKNRMKGDGGVAGGALLETLRARTG